MSGWVSSGMSERKQDVEKGSEVNTVRMIKEASCRCSINI